MKKGKVKNVVGGGAAFISSPEVDNDAYCPSKFVSQFNLVEGDTVEFEYKKTDRGYHVTSIQKIQNPLFISALKINELSPDEYDTFCDLANKYVKEEQFRKNITTSKIRNIFSAVLASKDVGSLKKLRPKLAYLAGRDKGTSFFMNDLDRLIKKTENSEEVKNFKSFFEAIVCYAKENEK